MTTKQLKEAVHSHFTEEGGLDGLKRWLHTEHVVKKALELKDIYGFRVTKREAETVALVHDYAKFTTREEFTALYQRLGKDPAELCEFDHLMHAFNGPEQIKEELGITDEKVLTAVRYHSTGRPNMTELECLLFLADFLEDTREAAGFLRSKIGQDYRKLIALILNYKINLTTKYRSELHPLTREAFNYYKEYLDLVQTKLETIVGQINGRFVKDVKIYDMRATTPLYDFAIVATAKSRKQMEAAVHALGSEKIKSIEPGEAWTLVDFEDVILHIFSEEGREHYGLDKLWQDLPQLPVK